MVLALRALFTRLPSSENLFFRLAFWGHKGERHGRPQRPRWCCGPIARSDVFNLVCDWNNVAPGKGTKTCWATGRASERQQATSRVGAPSLAKERKCTSAGLFPRSPWCAAVEETRPKKTNTVAVEKKKQDPSSQRSVHHILLHPQASQHPPPHPTQPPNLHAFCLIGVHGQDVPRHRLLRLQRLKGRKPAKPTKLGGPLSDPLPKVESDPLIVGQFGHTATRPTKQPKSEGAGSAGNH